MQDSLCHWTSHHAGQRMSLDVTPCWTAFDIGRHTVQDSLCHWTSHRAGQRMSLDVTPCRTAYVTGCHTVQDSVYNLTSHHAGQCLSLDIAACRTASITVDNTLPVLSNYPCNKYLHVIVDAPRHDLLPSVREAHGRHLVRILEALSWSLLSCVP